MVLLLLRTMRSNKLADYDVIIISIDRSFVPTFKWASISRIFFLYCDFLLYKNLDGECSNLLHWLENYFLSIVRQVNWIFTRSFLKRIYRIKILGEKLDLRNKFRARVFLGNQWQHPFFYKHQHNLRNKAFFR